MVSSEPEPITFEEIEEPIRNQTKSMFELNQMMFDVPLSVEEIDEEVEEPEYEEETFDTEDNIREEAETKEYERPALWKECFKSYKIVY